MDLSDYTPLIMSLNERSDIVIPGDSAQTIEFAINQIIAIANEAIIKRGKFAIALSGGTTPKSIFEGLSRPHYASQINWNKVWLFWSDERSVAPNHKDSNYRMAMEAGLGRLNIPANQIFRMEAEKDIIENSLKYENHIQKDLKGIFDLVMLGIGDDGHTASLFPLTHGLHSEHRLVVANYVPEHATWRMSLTFHCINHARHISIYALGKKKAPILNKVLTDPFDLNLLPVQGIGTPKNKALFIVDDAAAGDLNLKQIKNDAKPR